MNDLELKFLLLKALGGVVWVDLKVDRPEWTSPQYYHQN